MKIRAKRINGDIMLVLNGERLPIPEHEVLELMQDIFELERGIAVDDFELEKEYLHDKISELKADVTDLLYGYGRPI